MLIECLWKVNFGWSLGGKMDNADKEWEFVVMFPDRVKDMCHM